MTPAYEVLQLSDTHIFASREEVREYVNTYGCFVRTLDHALANTAPDIILLTGDLAEDYSTEAYEAIRDLLKNVGCPVYCLPGNHDHLGRMVEVIGNLSGGDRVVTRGAERLKPGQQVVVGKGS